MGKNPTRKRKNFAPLLPPPRSFPEPTVTENDYYTLRYNTSRSVVVKVSAVLPDSIEFLAPADLDNAPNLYGSPQKVGYFLSPDSELSKVKLSRSLRAVSLSQIGRWQSF